MFLNKNSKWSILSYIQRLETITWKSSRYTVMKPLIEVKVLLTVAGDATSRSMGSKMRLICGDIWMISPLIRHSFLLSSSTVFIFSIHTASTGPSKISHFLSGLWEKEETDCSHLEGTFSAQFIAPLLTTLVTCWRIFFTYCNWSKDKYIMISNRDS